jgi:ribosomal protein S18 acetylase RimI-like enzyme
MSSPYSRCQRQRNTSNSKSWLSLVLFSLACACFSRTNHGAHAFVVPASRLGQGPTVRISPQSSSVSSIRAPLELYSLLPLKFNGVATPTDTTAATATSGIEEAIPFVIEGLSGKSSDLVYQEISDMCIEAFFNDGIPGRKIPFWKEWQLKYLRALQQADLRRRRNRNPNTNMMFVARRVVPASADSFRKTPLILDLEKVVNLPVAEKIGGDYVRGQVLGFVEVTQRPYGLGESKVGFDEESKINLRKSSFYEKRPILTNLSVSYDARKSGLGSKLVDMCEQEVLSRWNMKEIILEVEDDNENALRFYQKRGYKILFADPASRQYDTSGLWLKQVRCNRQVMYKKLDSFWQIPGATAAVGVGSTMNQFGMQMLQRLKRSSPLP